MKLYVIDYWVNYRKNKGRYSREEQGETTVIDNIKTAIAEYKRFRKKLEAYTFQSRYYGSVRVFSPHIREDGSVVNFPDNEEYLGMEILKEGFGLKVVHRLQDEEFWGKDENQS